MSESPVPARGSDDVVEGEIVEDRPTPGPGPAPASATTEPDFDERGVPSFEHVRSKIEGRYATSLGAGELADQTPEGRSVAEQEAERERAARARLEEIRRSLGR